MAVQTVTGGRLHAGIQAVSVLRIDGVLTCCGAGPRSSRVISRAMRRRSGRDEEH